MPRSKRAAFTVIELLVVISIIGMLMALILPAVQMAREAGRRTHCLNNLRQQGLAMLSHHSAYQRFPSGGWGWAWVGDPDRGTGVQQPGGWLYSILPYLERKDLAGMGRFADPLAKKAALTKLTQTPVSVFVCPTRRGLELSLYNLAYLPHNVDAVGMVAKSDYAVNAGDFDGGGGAGPPTLADGDSPSWPWNDFSQANGICYLRSSVGLAHIRDGSGLTYLAGEKSVSDSGTDPGDDQSMYIGYDWDTYRWAMGVHGPLPDSGAINPASFGSSHPGGCQFVFCDGSARLISFDIEPRIHRLLANRQDRELFDERDLE
ncbi:MAG: DUF1559 domain-containing protein [Pirellulales bacterium]